ncbi:hypothetical protein LBX01_08365 [Altererythrobacter sp. N1]|nr:hypothetical protein LBX01_08365 [Altererythrobacter sp. N1]
MLFAFQFGDFALIGSNDRTVLGFDNPVQQTVDLLLNRRDLDFEAGLSLPHGSRALVPDDAALSGNQREQALAGAQGP